MGKSSTLKELHFLGKDGRPEPDPTILLDLQMVSEAYAQCEEELEALADIVPGSECESINAEVRIQALIDLRRQLLNRTASLPLTSLADVEVVLRLWHTERIEEQGGLDLSSGDRLVRSVCSFFGIV